MRDWGRRAAGARVSTCIRRRSGGTRGAIFFWGRQNGAGIQMGRRAAGGRCRAALLNFYDNSKIHCICTHISKGHYLQCCWAKVRDCGSYATSVGAADTRTHANAAVSYREYGRSRSTSRGSFQRRTKNVQILNQTSTTILLSRCRCVCARMCMNRSRGGQISAVHAPSLSRTRPSQGTDHFDSTVLYHTRAKTGIVCTTFHSTSIGLCHTADNTNTKGRQLK